MTKKRIAFFYTANGSTQKGEIKYDKNIKTKNSFVETLKTDSYLFLLEKLVDQKIIKDCIIFIESNRSPGSATVGKYNFQLHTIPNIYDSEQFLEKDDILFFRGGFRSWHDFIIDMQKKDFFCMLYAANTGRERWTFWDLILEDLHTEKRHKDRHGRVWLPFNKPVNTDIFYPKPEIKQKYDICIGASHITDKKGQWRIIDGLIKYRKKRVWERFGMPRCILPGCGIKGTHTRPMYEKIKKYKLNVALPGMVDRDRLSNILNQSKYFFYGGSGGQNDRSLLEAEACGTTVYFINDKRHALYLDYRVEAMILDNQLSIAYGIFDSMNRDLPDKIEVAERYNKNNGIHLALEQFKEIISKEIK